MVRPTAHSERSWPDCQHERTGATRPEAIRKRLGGCLVVTWPTCRIRFQCCETVCISAQNARIYPGQHRDREPRCDYGNGPLASWTGDIVCVSIPRCRSSGRSAGLVSHDASFGRYGGVQLPFHRRSTEAPGRCPTGSCGQLGWGSVVGFFRILEIGHDLVLRGGFGAASGGQSAAPVGRFVVFGVIERASATPGG